MVAGPAVGQSTPTANALTMSARSALPDALAPPRQLDALTSLRFVAAFAVLVLHYRDLLGPLPEGLMRAIVGGQYGVTFFFILSGFILTYRYHGWFAAGVRDAAYWRFQRLRVARIYPVYLLGLLLDTPWHLLARAQADQLVAQGPTLWASWLLNLVGLQAWVPAVPYAMFWNTPAWSVAAEFFFYAGFPFVAALLVRRVQGLVACCACFVAVVLAGVALYAAVLHGMNGAFGWPRAQPQTQYIVLVYNPVLRCSEFLAGCLAGLAFVRWLQPHAQALATPRAQRWRNGLIVLCLVLIAWRVMSPDYTGPSYARWLLDVSVKYAVFIGPFTLLILAVASGPSLLSRWLERPWLVLLGEASYALYITHWSVTSFLRLGYLGPWASPALHLLFMLGTVAASVAIYRWIELPWRLRLRGAPAPAAPAAVAPAAT